MKESQPMKNQQLLDTLGFTNDWVEVGIIHFEELQELVDLYSSGDDQNTEHYRWQVFEKYRKANHPLAPNTLEKLYKIAEKDADFSMGSAMMSEIIKDSQCPNSVLEKAFLSGRKAVQKKAKEIIQSRVTKP